MKPPETPKTGFARQSQLIPKLIPISPATFWRYVKSGTFPKPVKLSERITAWRWEDVNEWMLARSTEGGNQ
ncbi:MAG: AlpA family phage regulatory protein [Rhodocyclaceae bacterium]|nr:AlpA family phage regulatory protein [Rhodocyclaceae bacterium]